VTARGPSEKERGAKGGGAEALNEEKWASIAQGNQVNNYIHKNIKISEWSRRAVG